LAGLLDTLAFAVPVALSKAGLLKPSELDPELLAPPAKDAGDFAAAAAKPQPIRRRPEMATGTVKWFNAQKGFGFIQPDDGGKDVFVHATAVERAGMASLQEGQKIQYELATDRGKTAAANLKRV
jgi:CspA family cold shock protein